MALHEVRRRGEVDVVAAVTTVVAGGVSMHGLREPLLEAQAEALGLPLMKVELPSFPCPNHEYELAMGRVLRRFVEQGVEQVIYGDLFLEDIRAYRLQQLEPFGLEGVFPLWGSDTRELAEAILDAGIRATLVVVDPARLDASFAGRDFDRELLRDLPAAVDPCGENGEFHTFVGFGPGFRQPVAFECGEVTERDGFVCVVLRSATQGVTLG